MGKFFAWAATGIVTGLQIWPQNSSEYGSSDFPKKGPAHLQPKHFRRINQRFFLRQRDGREIEILLIGASMSVRNGHSVTAVWAARAKAPYGHCIYLENRTTGAIARLTKNLDYITRRISQWKIALIGFFISMPVIAAVIAWLNHSNSSDLNQQAFLMSSSLAAILLLIIGFVSSKLFFDYIKAEDERQIWIAADKALAQARTLLIQRPHLQMRG